MNEKELLKLQELSLFGKNWLESKIQRMKNLLKIAEPDLEGLSQNIIADATIFKKFQKYVQQSLLRPSDCLTKHLPP